jgi:hypothetical protein
MKPIKAWMVGMNVQQSSPLSTAGNRAIELRYEQSFLLAGVAACVMGAIGFIAWAILGPSETSMFFAIAGSPVALAVAVVRGRVALDRRPVVVIDAVGLRDRRLALPVIPWARISSADIENRVTGIGTRVVRLCVGATLHIEEGRVGLDPTLPYNVYIDLAPLAVTASLFVEYLHQFAPNLPLDRSLDNAAP